MNRTYSCFNLFSECNKIIFLLMMSIEFVNMENLEVAQIVSRRRLQKTSYGHKCNFVGKIKHIFDNLGNKSRKRFFCLLHMKRGHGKELTREF